MLPAENQNCLLKSSPEYDWVSPTYQVSRIPPGKHGDVTFTARQQAYLSILVLLKRLTTVVPTIARLTCSGPTNTHGRLANSPSLKAAPIGTGPHRKLFLPDLSYFSGVPDRCTETFARFQNHARLLYAPAVGHSQQVLPSWKQGLHTNLIHCLQTGERKSKVEDEFDIQS